MRLYHLFGLMIITQVFFFNNTAIAKADAVISNGAHVKFQFQLSVEGEVMGDPNKQTPMEYVHGELKILPGLEKALKGMKIGEKKTVHLGVKDAYGPVDPKKIIEVPRERFDDAKIREGDVVSSETVDGKTLDARVKQVLKSVIVLDFNHPYAGKEVTFDVEIIEIHES